MKRILIIAGLLFISTVLLAQELVVKSFIESQTDLTARTQPRKDINGDDCALVKVQLIGSGATFEGNVIGDVKCDVNTYYVYMPAGSKRLTIKHPDYLPLNVNFADYGILSLGKLITYTLTLVAGAPAIKYEEVGTLTAYYASVPFSYYKKGQLIVDSNDPINRMVNNNATTYKFEGNDTGEYYSSIIPKNKVRKEQYTMCQLPISKIGDKGITFVAKSGNRARIFRSKQNGHSFLKSDYSNGNYSEFIDEDISERYNECYVISVRMKNGTDTYLFEQPVLEDKGSVKLYVSRGRMFGGEGVRKRVNKIGSIVEEWCPVDEWPENRSAYDANGNLLVNLHQVDGVPGIFSIAYIPSKDALYFNGELYYEQK